jgi:hypothetical protein
LIFLSVALIFFFFSSLAVSFKTCSWLQFAVFQHSQNEPRQTHIRNTSMRWAAAPPQRSGSQLYGSPPLNCQILITPSLLWFSWLLWMKLLPAVTVALMPAEPVLYTR